MSLRELLISLYLAAFPDETPTAAAALFAAYFPDNCLYETVDGVPVSLLFLLDQQLLCGRKSLPVCYVYGAATHPDFRRRGYMTRLLERAADAARERGAKALFLLPADASLEPFYAERGFTGRLYHAERRCAPLPTGAPLNPISAASYRRLRKPLLPNPALSPDSAFLQLLVAEAVASGGGAFADVQNGVLALCARQNDCLLVEELLGSATDGAVARLLRQTGTTHAVVRGVPTQDRDRVPFGLFRPLADDLPQTAYFGLPRDW